MFPRLSSFIIVFTVGCILGIPAVTQDIFQAIQNGNIKQVEAILEKDKNAVHTQDKDKDTPLHYAASPGYKKIAELLIQKRASLNAQNHQGYTPLHWTVSMGYLNVAQILLTRGADVRIKTKRGRTPLFLIAMNNGNVSLAKMLLDAGADEFK